MTVEALPRYKTAGRIFVLIWLLCYLYAAILFKQPLYALLMILPLSLLLAFSFIAMYLDQNEVIYQIEDDGVRLIRKGGSRKFIRYDRIKSIQNRRGTVTLGLNGLGSQLMHPATHVSEFTQELEMRIRNTKSQHAQNRPCIGAPVRNRNDHER